MALISCPECGREISDKATSCPGCGMPLSAVGGANDPDKRSHPVSVLYDRQADMFTGSMPLMVKLAIKAVQDIGWKIDQVNESLGLITF